MTAEELSYMHRQAIGVFPASNLLVLLLLFSVSSIIQCISSQCRTTDKLYGLISVLKDLWHHDLGAKLKINFCQYQGLQY